MKKILSTLFMIVVLLSTTVATFATDTTTPVGREEEVVKIGYLKNYGVINEPIVRGSRGFGFEFFNEIAKHTNYKYEYVEVEWNEGLEKLKNGEIDIFGPADKTAERELIYDFVPKEFGYEDIAIYALKNSDYDFGDKEVINGSKIGAGYGIGYQEEIDDYIAQNNLDVEIVYTTDNDFRSRIENGEIDFALSGALFNQEGLEIVDIIDSKPFYFMTTKGNTELIEEISEALEKIEKTKKGYMYTLYNKYYGSSPYAAQSLTEEEIAALSEKAIYTVGYHCDWKPLSYTDEDGEPKGFAVDTMNEFAKELGIKIKYVPLHGEENYDISKLDFNLCMGEDECINHGKLSEPYVYLDAAALSINKAKTQEELKHIAAQDYSTLEIKKYLREYTDAQIHFAHNGTEYRQIIKDYNVDCIICLEPGIQLILNNNPTKDYEVTFIDTNTPLGIAVSNDLPREVYTALDKVIVGRDKTLVGKNIAKSLSELQKDVSFEVFLNKNGLLIRIIIIVVVCSLVTIYLRLVIKNAKKLKNLVEVDQVTGLMTMAKMLPEMAKLLANAKAGEYYILSFDIDNFKAINQTYGRKKGDKLLCATVNSMRKYASKDTLMCRSGNDIFVIFGKTANVSEFNIGHSLFSQEHSDEIMLEVGIYGILHFSIGVYIVEDVHIETEKLFNNVRKARLMSKEKYGNVITVYSEEFKLQDEKEMEIYTSMEQALRDKEFFIVVQPKIVLETGKLVGGEVLVRWKKKDGTSVYPDEFIPLFERNSFICQLDIYVFEEACKFVKNTKEKLPHISINISSVTVLSENFVEKYINILERHGLKAEQFEMEITESALDNEFDKISEITGRLRKYGFIISIDDFGKGASSLTRIQKVDVDVIKLDKGFIDNNFNTEKGNAVIANAIDLANSLGVTTLAEGIENKEQHEMLLELGCDLGQGYLFDKPLSTDEFLGRVIEDNKKEYRPALKSKEKIKKYLTNFENLHYPLVLLNNDECYTLIKANDAFYKLSGYTCKEFLEELQNHLTNISDKKVKDFIKEQMLKGNNSFSFDMRIKQKNGEYVWVNNNTTYIEEDDIFYSTLVDITDIKVKKNEALREEEISKVNLLEKTVKTLQKLDHADEKIKSVLDLLRVHYGADGVILVTLSEDRKTYSMTYESLGEGILPRRNEVQNQLINSVEKWDEYFISREAFVTGVVDDMPPNSKQRKILEKHGIRNITISPLYKTSVGIFAFISVNNITLDKRSKVLISVVAKTIGDYLEKLDMLEKYRREIAIDGLTKIGNKMSTQRVIRDLIKKEVRGILFIIDIDYFKRLNDKLGHSVGDEAIKEVANEIKKTFRDTDIVGRIGGDEFMVFCPGSISDDIVETKAKSICENCNKRYEKDGIVVEMSTSIGILRVDNSITSFKEAYEKVDKALYQAKRQGKNRFQFLKNE